MVVEKKKLREKIVKHLDEHFIEYAYVAKLIVIASVLILFAWSFGSF